ncbi:erythromycin esterase family protein [Gemmatimonas sp.]|uniref:erythromycin esterase family protein n=1 Tax=Gemmatimonas sp. TaxID=1962908 RepID=UPI0022C348BA|nr:erythromycin esterase family protein [Gemmatimonas sp.]MCZ8205029.1 erythromycin esterase family protein [Gemmatimonas sp.]
MAMHGARDHDLVQALRRTVHPLHGAEDDFAVVLARALRADLVLLGEASHGTHEYYRIRAELTKRLIREGHVTAILIEADWPDAWRVHRYVTARPDADALATDALAGFTRFPQWMWRNADMLDFVGWLRTHNEQLPPPERVGIFGLDLYSLHASIAALVDYLDTIDPDAADRARERYRCLDAGGADPQRYGRLVTLGLREDCEQQVVAQLVEMQRHADAFLRRDGLIAAEDRFFAEQNARLIRNAEHYHRALFGHPALSWNVRDRHMMETVQSLRAFLQAEQRHGALVLWAHNSHLGDTRATEMHELGEVNVGQLVRQAFGRAACLVGFTGYVGSVTASDTWGGTARCMRVSPAHPGSYEALFHEVASGGPAPNFTVDLTRSDATTALLNVPRLERAIGVLYRPATERQSHYFHARLPEQFDFVLHYDRTRAVEPLEHAGTWSPSALPETYPTAL